MTLTYYRSRTWTLKQLWRWRLTADNNRIVAASSEGFVDERGAKENALLTMQGLRSALYARVGD